MRKQSVIILLLIFHAAAGDLLACGDKYLVVSRGTRYQRAPVARPPAAILVYANPASELPRALTNVPVESTLRRAGYHPTSVSSSEEFERALRQGTWDLIVADLAEADAMRVRLQGAAGPILLPVIHNASAQVIAEAKRHYRILLKAPTRVEAFLETVDDAVALIQRVPTARK